jgi:HD-GYP domain-containing protein (c-di-GMP phosphodiesterase class II)
MAQNTTGCERLSQLHIQFPFLQDAAIIALSHHERYDGTGYPAGLKGNEISIEARIFAVADAYHAMRSDRPYKKAITPEQARIEIINGAGKQFDPLVVEAFEKCQDEIEAIFAMSNAKAEI